MQLTETKDLPPMYANSIVVIVIPQALELHPTHLEIYTSVYSLNLMRLLSLRLPGRSIKDDAISELVVWFRSGSCHSGCKKGCTVNSLHEEIPHPPSTSSSTSSSF